MAKTGFNVTIGADTKPFETALRKLNEPIKIAQKDLQRLNEGLKLNPTNSKILETQYKQLGYEIKDTEDKIRKLREAQNNLAKSYEEKGGWTEEQARTFQKLKGEIAVTEEELKKLQKEYERFGSVGLQQANAVATKMQEIGNKVENLGKNLALVSGASAGLIGVGLNFNIEMEKATKAFETFTGSAEKAEDIVATIREDSKKSLFDTNNLVSANKLLVSAGVDADKARQTINGLADAIALTGGGNDELNRMAYNLQQVQNVGKASALDIKQFALAGVDVYGMLGDYLGKTTAELKEMDITFEDLSGALIKSSKEGGRYFKGQQKMAETMSGKIVVLKKTFDELLGDITKSLIPIAQKVLDKAKEAVKWFGNLSDSQKELIAKTLLITATLSPLLITLGKITTSVGSMIKIFTSLTATSNLLVAGLAVVAVTIGAVISKAEETKRVYANIGEGFTQYYENIKTAGSYLEEFNDIVFATSEEQQALEQEMQDVQNGITEICQRASEERREYTDQEIEQLNSYFQRLRELNLRELELQDQVSNAILLQAQTAKESFSGTLGEYEALSNKWINTAEQQRDKEIALIESQTIQEIALLNQRFGDQANLQNEAYAQEYNWIELNKQNAINEANDKVKQIKETYSTGYTDIAKSEEGFYTNLQNLANTYEIAMGNHYTAMKFENGKWVEDIEKANDGFLTYNDIMVTRLKNDYKELYNSMSEEQQKELGAWLARLADTELYGGKITEEDKKMVDGIIANMDTLSPEMRETMKNAMQPMLEEMENKEPSLFSKAKGIADGILNRLQKAFDIHSPSKATRSIFKNVMLGAELGLKDETQKLNEQIDNISKDVLKDFSSDLSLNKDLQNSIIDSTKSIFTTPNIVFNVKEMTKEQLDMAFNYVNRKFGTAY